MSFSTSSTRPKSAGSLRRPNTPSNGMSNYSYRNFNSFNSPQNPLQISSQNSTSAAYNTNSSKKNGTAPSSSSSGQNGNQQQASPAQVDHWSTSYKLHYGYAAASEAIQMGGITNITTMNNNGTGVGAVNSSRPMAANTKASSSKQPAVQPQLVNISTIPDIVNNNNSNKYLNPPTGNNSNNNNVYNNGLQNNAATSSKNSAIKAPMLPSVGQNNNNILNSNNVINNVNNINNGRFPAVPLSAIVSQQNQVQQQQSQQQLLQQSQQSQQQYQQPPPPRSSADRIRKTVAASRVADGDNNATAVTDENGGNNVLYSHNGVKLSGNIVSNNSKNQLIKTTQPMMTSAADVSYDLSHMTVGVSVGVGQTTYHNTTELDHAATAGCAMSAIAYNNTHHQYKNNNINTDIDNEEENDNERSNIDTMHTNTREQKLQQQNPNQQIKPSNNAIDEDDDDDDEMDGKRLTSTYNNNYYNNNSSSSTHYGTSAPIVMVSSGGINGGAMNISNNNNTGGHIIHHHHHTAATSGGGSGTASESRSHPEVNTPSLTSLELGGSNITISSSSSVLLGGDGRNNSMDSLNDEFIDLGITTVPNQFCTVRDALELKRMLLLTHSTSVRGGMVPSATSVMDMYMVGKVIGVGSYGKVRAAWHRLTGAKVAIKTYDKSKMKDDSHWKRVHSEIKIMEQVSHPRIARMYEAIETPKRMHLIMECLEGGNLCSYVKQKRRLNEDEARGIFFQLIQSIEYLHSLNVTHRDIKLENILFTSNKENCRDIKLIDFGFSTVCQAGIKLKVFCGTPSYMAPEIVRRTEYEGKATDMWSLGILLYALLCGCFPFRAKSYPDLYRRIARGTFIIPDDINSSVRDLITQLLELDVNKRLTANIAIRHPWLQTALYLSPDMKKMRGDIPYLISDRPSDDLDESVLKGMEKFGMPREEIIRLILTKLHSSLTTFYYLLLDIAIRRRKRNSNASFNGNSNISNNMTEIKLSSYSNNNTSNNNNNNINNNINNNNNNNNNNMIHISSNGNNHNSSTASAKSTGAIPNRTSTQTLLQLQQQQAGINSFRDKTTGTGATSVAANITTNNANIVVDYPTINYLSQQQRPRSSSSFTRTNTISSNSNNTNYSNPNLASSATTNNLGSSNYNNNSNNNSKNNVMNINTIRLGSGNNNYNNNNNSGIQINQLQRPQSAYAGRRG